MTSAPVRPLATLADLQAERESADRRLDRLIAARPVSGEAAERRARGIYSERAFLRRLDEQIADAEIQLRYERAA